MAWKTILYSVLVALAFSGTIGTFNIAFTFKEYADRSGIDVRPYRYAFPAFAVILVFCVVRLVKVAKASLPGETDDPERSD